MGDNDYGWQETLGCLVVFAAIVLLIVGAIIGHYLLPK